MTNISLPSIAILAPGHAAYDERVIRTVEVAAEVGQVTYYCDPNSQSVSQGSHARPLGDRFASASSHSLQVRRLPFRHGEGYRSRAAWAKRITSLLIKLKTDIVHIHDSATLGLQIAHLLRTCGCGTQLKIVWDYHDWLPYEVAIRTGNRKLPYRIFLPLAEAVCRYWARAVDAAICISPGQLVYAMGTLRLPRGVSVQNVRPQTNIGSFDYSTEKNHRLVWMGQLMRMRRLEFILQVLHELSRQFPDAHLHIWGAVKESSYAAALHELICAHSLQEHVMFKGAYQSDSEVRDSLTTGTLAIMPGWSDPLGTGINAIASTNKFFSYLNLGLPILLEDGLDNMVQLAVPSGAALTYQPTATSCAAVVKRIWEDDDLWHTMAKRSLQLSLTLNNECAKHTLRNLYDDMLRRN